MLANGQNSLICSEESCNNPFADSIITSESIYNLCLEEAESMNLCACGCGQEIIIKPYHKYGGVPKFIRGHHTKDKRVVHSGSFKKGHAVPIEWRQKVSDACSGKMPKNPIKRGEHRGLKTEFKRNQIPWNKGRNDYLCDELRIKMGIKNLGKEPPNKGSSHSEKTKLKMRHNHANFKKERNPNWKGGTSYIPYCHKFNEELKEHIRERDSRTCQLCGVKENGRRLDIHHVHYDKPNCNPDLITLCRRCNFVVVEQNRDYYEKIFMEKLKERGLL